MADCRKPRSGGGGREREALAGGTELGGPPRSPSPRALPSHFAVGGFTKRPEEALAKAESPEKARRTPPWMPPPSARYSPPPPSSKSVGSLRQQGGSSPGRLGGGSRSWAGSRGLPGCPWRWAGVGAAPSPPSAPPGKSGLPSSPVALGLTGELHPKKTVCFGAWEETAASAPPERPEARSFVSLADTLEGTRRRAGLLQRRSGSGLSDVLHFWARPALRKGLSGGCVPGRLWPPPAKALTEVTILAPGCSRRGSAGGAGEGGRRAGPGFQGLSHPARGLRRAAEPPNTLPSMAAGRIQGSATEGRQGPDRVQPASPGLLCRASP